MTLFHTDENGEPTASNQTRSTREERRRSAGIGLLVGSVIVALTLAVVPSPYVVEQPGPVFDTLGVVTVNAPVDAATSSQTSAQTATGETQKTKIPLITISGATTFSTTGALDLLTVSVLGNPENLPSWMEIIGAWFDPSKAVVPASAIFPSNESQQERDAANTTLMTDSQQDAIAAALTQLGYDVVAGIEVDGFSENSPAESVLQSGDVITAFAGTTVRSVQGLRDAVAASGAGVPATLNFIHLGVTTEGTVTPIDNGGNAIIGIGAKAKYDFPFDVTIRLDDVGGPSAGMMFALGIIDKLTPQDIAGGAHVAGTGTIDSMGIVGPIGGIRQKLYGARAAGATVFLAPSSNCDEVVGHIPSGLDVYAVTTLQDSLNVLAFTNQYGDKAGEMNAKTSTLATCQN
ncbi:PDZ domain-containing protein [Alpinimonas psychrophila]|uniref:endopeptidase La n=1 Tax=Alpinimonas psychrophila TaxID=748908 RepID=A0A7W3JS93_9MICO|nr:S16 family serine protease [Alpinimonas psychrophila]MBA8828207.1 PDZ domain-containing protein [Alpinimonas psychrophila]